MTYAWPEFSRKLFYYEEADPLYYALARSGLPRAMQMRYVVAMFCSFYHHGLAGETAQYQGADFWDYLRHIYPTAKRASERRHFRGKAGLEALANMQAAFPQPEAMVEHLWAPTYMHVRAKIKALPTMLVGDYFIWKFADAQDRIFGIPCDFAGAAPFSSTVPAEGARLIGEAEGLPVDKHLTGKVYDLILGHADVKHLRAPPWYDRPLLLQEAETICCFWHKLHMGKYHFGAATAKALKDYAMNDNPINRTLAEAQTMGLPVRERYE